MRLRQRFAHTGSSMQVDSKPCVKIVFTTCTTGAEGCGSPTRYGELLAAHRKVLAGLLFCCEVSYPARGQVMRQGEQHANTRECAVAGCCMDWSSQAVSNSCSLSGEPLQQRGRVRLSLTVTEEPLHITGVKRRHSDR